LFPVAGVKPLICVTLSVPSSVGGGRIH